MRGDRSEEWKVDRNITPLLLQSWLRLLLSLEFGFADHSILFLLRGINASEINKFEDFSETVPNSSQIVLLNHKIQSIAWLANIRPVISNIFYLNYFRFTTFTKLEESFSAHMARNSHSHLLDLFSSLHILWVCFCCSLNSFLDLFNGSSNVEAFTFDFAMHISDFDWRFASKGLRDPLEDLALSFYRRCDFVHILLELAKTSKIFLCSPGL